MEGREEEEEEHLMMSVLPFLPPMLLLHRNSSNTTTTSSNTSSNTAQGQTSEEAALLWVWPSGAHQVLNALSKGPNFSQVSCGEILFDAIVDLREQLGLSKERLNRSAAKGYALYFDKLISHDHSNQWFETVLPALSCLLLRLPALLQAHYYKNKEEEEEGRRCIIEDDSLTTTTTTNTTTLRILGSQQPGIVFMTQELIAALLSCSFLCLFPTTNRRAKLLQEVNFDHLFAGLCHNDYQKQENKITCLMHYFGRICHNMPQGVVSFERKVLLFDGTYPQTDFWGNSTNTLCSFQVINSGNLEDQEYEALEVDFANEYLGGGALHRGCVQEEIRFMINPELIAGMLFLPSMSHNEAIEIVGVERFAKYTGYSSTFRFAGNYLDHKVKDAYGRRKTGIVAIDALCGIGEMQYEIKNILRETNKAFCGFKKSNYRQASLQCSESSNKFGSARLDASCEEASNRNSCSTSYTDDHMQSANGNVTIVTGNWGCGAFGGDPELKSMIQWLAASRALSPCLRYYTFGEPALDRLEQVTGWIVSHNWTVGDLWQMLVAYSSQRLNGDETVAGFFSWLLPINPA